MDGITCPQCNYENPIEATVCEQCNADLSPVKSLIDTANGHYNRALSLAHEGRLDEALGQLDAAIALSSQNPTYYNLLGTINAQKGLFSEAIRAWERCLALHPEMEKAFENIDKARRMEEIRAEELEERPQWMMSLIAYVAAGVFLLTTVVFGVGSFNKSRKINSLNDNLIVKETESNTWKAQFESLNAQFPTEGINGVLKKLTQSETLIADRDKKIADLEQKMQKSSDNFRDRTNELRDSIKQLQQEKADLQQQLKTIENLQGIITQNETQIDELQVKVTTLEESLKTANERAETHKNNLLLAQDTVKQLQEGRDTAIGNAQKSSGKEIQDLRNQLLELRDEIARKERAESDRQYANNLIAESLQSLNRNDFSLAGQNINTALERDPENPAAKYLRESLDTILDDPLEQEIRRQEKSARDTRRTELKSDLINRNLALAKQHYTAGQYDDAIDLAQKTISLNPENPKDAASLREIVAQSEERSKEIVILLLEAQKDIAAKNYKEADVKLKQILKRVPKHKEANALLQQIPSQTTQTARKS